MTMHLHHLTGCAPTPLAHYLKAIGILRVVAQQKDPEVRGFWRDQHFCLLTHLDQASLERFFLEEYAPTPFVSPWNKGSGFFSKEDAGLGPLERSTAPRFAPFRKGIADAREQLDAITVADARVREIKNRTKAKGLSKQQKAALKNDPAYKKELANAEREFKALKADLFIPFALAWRGPHREWMDAAMVLSAEGEPSWPALLGTGGNDGRLDFTNTAMHRLGDLFDLASPDGSATRTARPLLKTALFETPSAEFLNSAVGQFLPGSAGGANGTTGPDAESRINPWDFVLMLEGTIAFRGQLTRRLSAKGDLRAAIPFAVSSQQLGNATRGKENNARGEQWMPLWSTPANWPDVRAVIGEGRAQFGRASARRPLDFARAVARLGVARGLTGFVRYGYLERNGQSNLAVPLGMLSVAAHPRGRLVDEIGSWFDRLQREAGEGSARFSVAVTALSDAVFDVLTREAEPARWQALLIAVDEVQTIQATGTAFKFGPCPALSKGWLEAAADDSPEWRLAVALGSAARGYRERRPFDTVRAHALPLKDGKGWRYAVGADKRLVNDPRVVMMGREPLGDLIALVERRIVESSQRGGRTLPLVGAWGAGAQLDDLARFVAGEVDAARVVTLARALMAIDWEHARVRQQRSRHDGAQPDEAWQALRLCGLPFKVNDRNIVLDPAMFRRLAGGDASAAVEIALRRLRSAGFTPPVTSAFTDPSTARRWAAAFAFPIDPAVASAMAMRFEKTTNKEKQ